VLATSGRGRDLPFAVAIIVAVSMVNAVPALSATPGVTHPLRPSAQTSAENGRGQYDLSNGYWRVTGTGATSAVATDPGGNSAYEDAPLEALRLGGATTDTQATWERDGDSLTVHTHAGGPDRTFRTSPAETDPAAYAVASDSVQRGHSLGQTFSATADVLLRVDVPVYTFGASDAVLGRATLRRGGPDGPVVLQTEKLAVHDGDYVSLLSSGLPGGVYYVELADATKPVAWPKVPPAYTGGEGYQDGTPAPATDRYVRVVQRDAGLPVALTYTLDGPQLVVRYTVSPASSGSILPTGSAALDPGVELDSPWTMRGYGLSRQDGVGISRFHSDSGHYLGAAQFKRDTDRVMQDYYNMVGTSQLRIDGTGTADVVVERPHVMARWSMGEHVLTTRITGDANGAPGADGSMSWELALSSAPREADNALGEQFPEFVAADPNLARLVTSLFRERALSFTGDTFTDLREWMGLERDWTANPLARAERAQLLADHLDPSGYVWSWPTQQGWPWLPSPAALLQANTGQTAPTDFSTYDSRHFTTNSNFILGSARWWSWTHDAEFLKLQIPRVRAALDYLLRAAPTGLAGQDGLIITDESHDGIRNHEGLPGPSSAGSNWWDGLPYGHLDAYANLYFYQALEAASQLEEAAGDAAKATQLEALRSLVRERYQHTLGSGGRCVA